MNKEELTPNAATVSAAEDDRKLVHIHYIEKFPPDNDDALEENIVLSAKKDADITTLITCARYLFLYMEDEDGEYYAEEDGVKRTHWETPEERHRLYMKYSERGWNDKIIDSVELAAKEYPEYGIEMLDYYDFSPRQLWKMDWYEEYLG